MVLEYDMIGTNPIAMATPAGQERPFVLDAAVCFP